MTEVGKWIGWNGGEMPFHKNTKFEVIILDTTCGESEFRGEGSIILIRECWLHAETHKHVIAYRVVKEYKEPREFWMASYPDGAYFIYDTKEECEAKRFTRDGRVVQHFREVIED
jgi:hypothetical protein